MVSLYSSGSLVHDSITCVLDSFRHGIRIRIHCVDHLPISIFWCQLHTSDLHKTCERVTAIDNEKIIMEENSKMIEEILAFAMHRFCADKTGLTDALMEWQTTEDTRKLHRVAARNILYELEEQGIVIRVSKQKKVEEAIEHILTIPARKAYVLD